MTTVTTTPDVTRARVRVVLMDPPAGASLTRTHPDGTTHPVRSGQDLTGQDVLVDDYECPFGVPVRYGVGDVTSAAVTLDVRSPWLTHPTDPTLGVPVVLVDDDEWTWTAPGTVHEPVASEWPPVVYGPRTRHAGVLRVRTTWPDRDRVERLLAPGSPLLLRVPPDCYADDAWVWPADVTRRKSSPHNPATVAWELRYQRVAAPGGNVTDDPTNAWVAVVATHPSWDDLTGVHPDWLDVLVTPHPHSLPTNPDPPPPPPDPDPDPPPPDPDPDPPPPDPDPDPDPPPPDPDPDPDPTLYEWVGQNANVILTGPGQMQRFGTGALLFHVDGPRSGPPIDTSAGAVGTSLTMTGQTSGASHAAIVTNRGLQNGHPRITINPGVPNLTFAEGELVAVEQSTTAAMPDWPTDPDAARGDG